MARAKQHFKVYASLPYDPKMVEVNADNALLGTWVRIGVEAARKRDDLRREISANRSEIVAAIERRDGVGCLSCGTPAPYHVDHVHPLAHGGTNDLDNLQLLCPPCNLGKGAVH